MTRPSSLDFGVFLALAATVLTAYNCSAASKSRCGKGVCINYRWSNSTCIPLSRSYVCGPGQKYSNATLSCISCANVGQALCLSVCSDFYFSGSPSNSSFSNSSFSNFTFSNSSTPYNFSSNSSNSSSGSCISCALTYGQGCSACSSSSCSACASAKYILAPDRSHCQDRLCLLSDCYQCADHSSCAICRTGFVTDIYGLCTKIPCPVPFCTICKDYNCLACGSGYFL